MEHQITKQPLSKKQKEKITSDLESLRKLLKFAEHHGFRIVVSGGYGLDIALGGITRAHNDIDVVVFEKGEREKTVRTLKKFMVELFPNAAIKTEPNLFNTAIEVRAQGFGGDLYVVETIKNPFDDINTIRLANGKAQVNDKERFPLPIKAKLSGIHCEAQNPNLHLADILYKRQKDNKLRKHIQDISNLRQITDETKVESILSQY